METREKHRISEWLDKIQQDSWQLELVISGFSIFLMLGLLQTIEKIRATANLMAYGMGQAGNYISVGWAILAAVSIFILINLIVHVVLRGLWISAIGLRSVSGDIDFEQLRLSPRFDRFLRRRIGSFDNYIDRLENLCSIVFAFTFLIVFVILSIGLWVLLMGIATQLGTKYLPQALLEPVLSLGGIIYFLAACLYVLDFITLGWVKRWRWFSGLYFIIYRFFSFFSLSALYRPLYYNLIDNKLGKRLGFLLIPYIILVLWMISLRTESHVWFPEQPGGMGLSKDRYDDLREENRLVGPASIPSRYVSNGFLELFIRYYPSDDDKVFQLKCPDIKPARKPGIRSNMRVQINSETLGLFFNLPEKRLACMSAIYEISVNDSLYTPLQFRFFAHPNKGEKGLLTVLDVNHLPRGEHLLQIKKLNLDTDARPDSLVMKEFVSFPFWKE